MLLACVATVVATCVLAPLVTRLLGRSAGWILSIPLLAAAAGLIVLGSGTQHVPWMPTLGIGFDLRLDGLSLTFMLLVLLIGAAVLTYSSRYFAVGRHTRYFTLMTAFAAAMTMLVLANDVVLLFVSWELTTLCSFLLIARSGAKARRPAIRTLLVTAMGGLSLLGAVTTMAVATGTTQLSEIIADPMWQEDTAVASTVIALLAIAAFTKSAQFPFQAWLPDSMVAITPVSAYLHAAAMVKAGIYLLLRFSPAFSEVPLWNTMLITSGLITALLGAVAALRRYDLKELLAYSTISQLGLLVAMIGVGTPEAIKAATVHTVAHALFKSALFLFVGVIDHRAGTRDIRALTHMRIRMPVTLGAITISAASMAGLPPLLGFVSKESMFTAFVDAPATPWGPITITVAAAVASALTFAYSARIVMGARGHDPDGREVTEVRPAVWAAPSLAALAGLVLGLMPFTLDPLISGAATAATGTTVEAHLALWHGFNLPLLISALVITTGVLLVLARKKIQPVLLTYRLPFSALDVVEAILAGLARTGRVVSGWSSSTAPRLHLAMPVIVTIGIGTVGVLGLSGLPAIDGNASRPLDWVLVVLLAAGVIAAMMVSTRVGAVVVVGVVGFAMTLWFMSLGAADVALTQLLVEILTVTVMVLLLRRLPTDFKPTPLRRTLPSLVIAVAAGLTTTLGVWALTGRRSMSSAAEYYLTEGEGVTGGANVVNTILVDFRALDTLGELSVLGVAGIVIATLLRSRRPASARRIEIDENSPLADALDNSVFTRTLARLVGPLIVILSVFLLLRGHQEPGGGFIAALVGGAGFALIYLMSPTDDVRRIRLPYLALIGAGIVIGAGTGLFGLTEGSFLAPLHTEILGYKLTSALVFDVGVYLAVIGIVLSAFNLLGLPHPHERDAAHGFDEGDDGDDPHADAPQTPDHQEVTA
ncbi:DUF4040 family protein [Demequina aestuarii]|uniref:DUF4040 family protein n=1 Tax=Demequina aestuarii TaxID=327095 RepID=UPI0007804424|nr:DUF4040 family protein [Demequina aestuarii]